MTRINLTRLIFILLLFSAWCVAFVFVFAAARAEATPAAYFPLVYGRQTVSSAPMALEAYPAPQPLPTACAWPCNIPPIPTPAPINPNCDYDPSPCEG